MKQVNATVVQGHAVASGRSRIDRRFPEGTIGLQLPLFKSRGVDVVELLGGNAFVGTLNLTIAPHVWHIAQPEYHLQGIKWTPIFAPENFYLSMAAIVFKDRQFRAILYMPDPATKPDHFKPADLIEVLAEPIEAIAYGDRVELAYNPTAIELS